LDRGGGWDSVARKRDAWFCCGVEGTGWEGGVGVGVEAEWSAWCDWAGRIGLEEGVGMRHGGEAERLLCEVGFE
jgi:hypothetical protein